MDIKLKTLYDYFGGTAVFPRDVFTTSEKMVIGNHVTLTFLYDTSGFRILGIKLMEDSKAKVFRSSGECCQ